MIIGVKIAESILGLLVQASLYEFFSILADSVVLRAVLWKIYLSKFSHCAILHVLILVQVVSKRLPSIEYLEEDNAD